MHMRTYRSTEPPRPTNVDELYRLSGGDDYDRSDYYDRPSIHDSARMAALCFLAMLAIGALCGLYEIALWLFS